jgi:copper(I)-binding protein
MHVMLTGLKEPLVEGKSFELDLLFEVAGPRKVKVAVRKD